MQWWATWWKWKRRCAISLAARPACAHVVDRFNQLQAAMTEEQREALRAHWVSTSPRRGQVPPVSPLRGLIAVLLMLLTMGLVHAFGYWRLHREGLRRQALEQRLQEVTANL